MFTAYLLPQRAGRFLPSDANFPRCFMPGSYQVHAAGALPLPIRLDLLFTVPEEKQQTILEDDPPVPFMQLLEHLHRMAAGLVFGVKGIQPLIDELCDMKDKIYEHDEQNHISDAPAPSFKRDDHQLHLPL
jgi:hypothetical protein